MDSDVHFMQLALREAKRGYGKTSPNPRVGALLVSDGKVLVRSYHQAFGEPHAEARCLSALSQDQSHGATLYVNLEPCCHFGKTPPCTEAIIQAGVRRVVFGLLDPNPQVNGQGLERLKQAGIEVVGPILEEPAREINQGYLKHRRTHHPWITLKWAQSLDGRIAASSGDARWISCAESLKLAHQLRAEHDAVLIGINTVLRDDPLLTVRQIKGQHPRRIILDSQLRFPLEAAMLRSGTAPIIIATGAYSPVEKSNQLQDAGAEILWLPADKEGLDLSALLDELGRRGVLYLLVEGGSRIFASFIQQGLFDEIVLVIAPLLIGGDGISSTGSLGVAKISQAKKLEVRKKKALDQDIAYWLRPHF